MAAKRNGSIAPMKSPTETETSVMSSAIGGRPISSRAAFAVYGAWDNAKKYVEAGNVGGEGGAPHHAAVVGDRWGSS